MVFSCVHPLSEPDVAPAFVTRIELVRIDPLHGQAGDTAATTGDPHANAAETGPAQPNPAWILTAHVNQWLALRSRVSPAAISLTVDGVDIPAQLSWDPVRRALEATFRAPPSGRLDIVFDDERLVAIDGQPLHADSITLRLEDAPTAPPPEQRPPVRFSTDLQDAIDASCGSCHGPPATLPALRPATLRNVPSRHVQGRALVEPGEPARSVLLHLVIDGYPVPEGRRKPPAWADPAPPPLPEDLPALLARWIIEGARDD